MFCDGVRATRRRQVVAVSILAFTAAALLPANSAASITFGSDLSGAPSATPDDCTPLSTPPCTHLLVGVRGGSAFPAASPTSGTVKRFGIQSGAADTVTFRLGRLTPNSPVMGRGAGTGPTVTLPAAGAYSFPADLRVRVGDLVGVDSSSVSAVSKSCPPGGLYYTFFPTLVNSGRFQSVDSNSTCELLVNATVEPDNEFTFRKPRRNRNRGTATLPVVVPGPGGLTLTGRRIKKATADAARAGRVTLPVKPTAKLRGRLNRKGSATVNAKVRFEPDGGHPGTQAEQVELIKR